MGTMDSSYKVLNKTLSYDVVGEKSKAREFKVVPAQSLVSKGGRLVR